MPEANLLTEGRYNQKPPVYSEGLAAYQDICDFTHSAALIFKYDVFQ
jgi:hypothetical protein